jgi:hypothetical protein
MKLRSFTIFIISLVLSKAGLAQCCSAGNPFFYGEQATMQGQELQVLLGYKYSFSDTYYSDSKRIDIDFVDQAYFNYLNLQLIYGLTQRISLETELGYFLNKTEDYQDPAWQSSIGYGLGDATVKVRYLAYTNFKRKLLITPSLGIKLPIGVFDQETVDHVKLPITVQPSSGSYKYQASIYINKSTKNALWNFGFYGSFEYAQPINSKNFNYKYGNMYLFSVLGSYKIGQYLYVGLEIRNENRSKSKRDNDQIVKSSGYNIIYTIPHVSLNTKKQVKFSFDAEIPTYRYYNGIQLGNKMAFSVRVSYQINFQKKIDQEQIFKPIED